MMVIGLQGAAGAGKDTVAAMIAPTHLVKINGVWVDVAEKIDKAEAMRRRQESLRSNAAQIAIADPFKVFAREVYNFTFEQVWGPSAARDRPDERYRRSHLGHTIVGDFCRVCSEPSGTHACVDYLTPREALQTLGTQWGYTCWPGTWIALALRNARELIARPRINKPVSAHVFAASWTIESIEMVVVSDVRRANELDAIHDVGGQVWRIKRSGAAAHLAVSAAEHTTETELAALPDADFDEVIDNSGTFADLRREVIDRIG